MRLACWNMAHTRRAWEALVQMADVDVALLQEASRLPEELRHRVDVDHRLWREPHDDSLGYPSVVARLSDRVDVSFIATRMRRIDDAWSHDLFTSEWGTLGAATVTPIDGDESLTVVSMANGGDIFTHESGSPSRREGIGSVHRLISDLARLVGRRSRVIAAGDLSINHDWNSDPTGFWKEREALHSKTAFDRMRALGFRLLIPEGRRGYRDAVVTFRPIGLSPAQAWGQLDFVFATENIADRVSVHALNDPSTWGPSDHCRLVIDYD